MAPGLHDRLTERQALALAVLALMALGLVFSIGYPLANSGRFGEGSDRDEALDIATSRLLSGQYPYHARTYLDNPISPMPGALLLAAPFVALGRSAYQNLAWLLMFAVVVRFPKGELDNRYTLLMIFSLFLLAPVVVYELVTGSDLMANALYVLIALILLTRAEPGDAPVGIGLKAAFFGVALSSRANFLLLMPLVFAALVRRHGWPRALRYSGISLVAFTVVTLPFWLYDPGGFSPLGTVNEIRLFNIVLPHSEIVFPLLAAGTAIWLALRKPAEPSGLLRDCAAVQLVPVLLGVLLPVVLTGRLFLSYGISFGDSFLFFAFLYFWQKLGAKHAAGGLRSESMRFRRGLACDGGPRRLMA